MDTMHELVNVRETEVSRSPENSSELLPVSVFVPSVKSEIRLLIALR